MANTIKRLSKLVLPAAALSLSVFGLAAGSSAHQTDDKQIRLAKTFRKFSREQPCARSYVSPIVGGKHSPVPNGT